MTWGGPGLATELVFANEKTLAARKGRDPLVVHVILELFPADEAAAVHVHLLRGRHWEECWRS